MVIHKSKIPKIQGSKPGFWHLRKVLDFVGKCCLWLRVRPARLRTGVCVQITRGISLMCFCTKDVVLKKVLTRVSRAMFFQELLLQYDAG